MFFIIRFPKNERHPKLTFQAVEALTAQEISNSLPFHVKATVNFKKFFVKVTVNFLMLFYDVDHHKILGILFLQKIDQHFWKAPKFFLFLFFLRSSTMSKILRKKEKSKQIRSKKCCTFENFSIFLSSFPIEDFQESNNFLKLCLSVFKMEKEPVARIIPIFIWGLLKIEQT